MYVYIYIYIYIYISIKYISTYIYIDILFEITFYKIVFWVISVLLLICLYPLSLKTSTNPYIIQKSITLAL